MNILTIGLDPKLLEPESPAFKRQERYFDAHSADCIVLGTGDRVEVSHGSFKAIRIGGATKTTSFFSTLSAVLNMTKLKKYDLIVTQDVLASGLIGAFVARRKSLPLITQLHGDYLNNPLWIRQRKSNILWNQIGKKVLKKSVAVRVVSRRILDDIVEHYGISSERVVSVPIGSDLSVFSPAGKRATSAPTALFVGRLIEEKSPLLFVETMIDLMKTRSDLIAAIAGEGDMRAEMESRFKQAGLIDRTIFLGNLGPEALAEWYRSSLCLIHTAAWEGWGMPMIEALGCGCPVVTTNSGCANEAVIDGRNGLVVGVDDLKGLIAASSRIIDNPAFRKKLSDQAILDAREWSFDALKKKLLSFYETYAKKD